MHSRDVHSHPARSVAPIKLSGASRQLSFEGLGRPVAETDVLCAQHGGDPETVESSKTTPPYTLEIIQETRLLSTLSSYAICDERGAAISVPPCPCHQRLAMSDAPRSLRRFPQLPPVLESALRSVCAMPPGEGAEPGASRK